MSHVQLSLSVNNHPSQVVAVFPYRVNAAGKIKDPEQLRAAIQSGESYASLVYLAGGTSTLYKMMRQHFGGTLVSLRRRWGVTKAQIKA